jgi:hypothetical protein
MKNSKLDLKTKNALKKFEKLKSHNLELALPAWASIDLRGYAKRANQMPSTVAILWIIEKLEQMKK